jgi:diguanylate cyclase (GGDEF)-like protein
VPLEPERFSPHTFYVLNLSKKFGFGPRRQRERLALVGLTGDTKALCYKLQRDVLRPGREEIVRDFLVWLRRHDELIQYLGNVDQEMLRAGLRTYVETFGILSESYFEGRFRIGLTHYMLEIPVTTFTCAHGFLQELFLGQVLARVGGAEARELGLLATRILTLDLSLVLDTYRLAEVHKFVRSLRDQMDETHKLRVKATQDPLTQLPNREHLMTLADQSLHDAQEGGEAFGLIMLDIDHFKRVNDTYGHPAGDAVLISVASTMRNALRGDDIVGRYGGEEFMIVLRSPRGSEFYAVAERLRQLVARAPIPAEGHSISVTASQGLAVATSEETLEQVIKRADVALYEAKEEGRDRVILSPPPPRPEGA